MDNKILVSVIVSLLIGAGVGYYIGKQSGAGQIATTAESTVITDEELAQVQDAANPFDEIEDAANPFGVKYSNPFSQ